MIKTQDEQSNKTNTKPRAFINVLFFDEQFKAVDYRVSMVGSNSVVKDHYAELQNIPVPKNGYVYIYCSNESPVNVFFDNMQVSQTKGPILEETHYYPFGLTMSGISSKAAGKLENKYKFNGGTELANKEFSDGSGLELYETDFRSYDAQIGRFHQIDPLADYAEYNSPYLFASNNPIAFNDPTGLIDTGHVVTHETSTVNKPTDLNSVTVFVPAKIRPKVDNVRTVITDPSKNTPRLVAQVSDQGGLNLRGDGGDSPATPSTGGDHQSVEIGMLLNNFSMTYYAAPFERSNLFNPYEVFGRTMDWLDLKEAAKKAEEKKISENTKPKIVTKTVLNSVFLRKGAIVYDRMNGIKLKMLGNGIGEPSKAPATDTFPAQKIPGYFDYPH